ncbi:MAG: hypothetical protein R6W78_13035 [Bacteroidales bacterium]
MRIILFIIIALMLNVSSLSGQTVYQHVSSTQIYAFLDEMANVGFIELNSAVKPYARMFIAEKLAELDKLKESLNQRQQKELFFYLKDYNKELKPSKDFDKRFDLFYYKDSLFTFSFNLVLGLQYWTNENEANYHRRNGGEVFSYVGKNIGVYASLTDNHEEKTLSAPQYLDTRQGARYKSGDDYSEMRGGITYTWKWGSFGLIKDHFEWGNHYHYPSILSGKVPSVTQLRLNIKPAKWFEFNYIHGWLASGVVDSIRSYPYTNSYGSSTRIVYRKKFIAANLFTFRPFKKMYASVGNSIVYSDTEAHPAYLIPFLLYKSVDHTLNQGLLNDGGHNSQFFIDISSRQINHLHLYATLFFDDIAIGRTLENGHPDYYSLNAGFQISNLLPNTFFTVEYFQSYPLVYKHNMPTTTYESNLYNLGHYLQDNSKGIYTEFAVRPLRGLYLKAYYNNAIHGRDHAELGTPRLDVVHLYLDSIEWKQSSFGLQASYQLMNDLFIFAGFELKENDGNEAKYTAPYFMGRNNTFTFGVSYGFY